MAGSNGGPFIPTSGMGFRQHEMAKDAYDKARGNSYTFSDTSGGQANSAIGLILAIPVFVCALCLRKFFHNFDFKDFFVNVLYLLASLLFLFSVLSTISYIINRRKKGVTLLPRFYLKKEQLDSSGLVISDNSFLRKMLLILFVLNAILTAFANHKYQTKFFLLFGLFIILFSYGVNYVRHQIKRIQVV